MRRFRSQLVRLLPDEGLVAGINHLAGCGGRMTSLQRLTALALLLGGCAVGATDDERGAEVVAERDSALCKNALSASQEKATLKLIDDICGDTWCEGDNDFRFERLTCRAGAATSLRGGTCTLMLRILPRVDGAPAYPRACTTGGFHGFDSLVDTAESGYQSLNWDYYLALSDCINQLEAELPR